MTADYPTDKPARPEAGRATSQPRFSVVMPAYNARETISRAITSVRNQERDDWELIIVDDGSSDETLAAATDAANGDSRVLILHQTNCGAAQARNNAVARASGEFICFLDSDDAMSPSYLSIIGSLVDRKPDSALYSGNARCIDPSGTTSPWLSKPEFASERSFSLLQLIRENIVFTMATVRSDAFRSIGGMDPTLDRCEDYDLWLRLLAVGYRHVYTPEVLGDYYRRPGSLSSDYERESAAVARIIRSLLEGYELQEDERDLANARITSALARKDLEHRRLLDDYHGTRREAWGTLPAFGSVVTRLIGAVLATMSPGLYFRVVSARRNRQLASLYAMPGDPYDATLED